MAAKEENAGAGAMPSRTAAVRGRTLRATACLEDEERASYKEASSALSGVQASLCGPANTDAPTPAGRVVEGVEGAKREDRYILSHAEGDRPPLNLASDKADTRYL